MIMFLPDTDEHVLVRLLVEANGDETWGCGVCGHTRVMNFDPEMHRNDCTQRGDFSVKHCMGASCAPELDAAVRLNIGSHNTPPSPPGSDPMVAPPTDTPTYSGCGIRWKNRRA